MAYVPKITVVNTTEKPTAAQDKILRGANFLADAVKQTLGPYGRNFLLEKGLKITNDGISIAKEITLKDEAEDLGVRIAREALVKTNDLAGDGTTTAATLMQAILREAVRLLPGKTIAGKKSAIQVRKQIAEESKLVIEKLKAMAKPVQSEAEMIEVARVAVEDEVLATLIGKAQWALGPEGTLIAEETNEHEDSEERISGIRFDNGFGTGLLVNNHEKQRLEVENAWVIMTNHTFQDLLPIKQLLESMKTSKKTPIVLIARGFTDGAIKTCLQNTKNGFPIYPINAPYVNQREVMEDLAAVIGGSFCDSEARDLESLIFSDLGFAKKVLCYRFSAIFSGDKNEATQNRIKARVEKLQKELAGDPSVFMKKMISTRISQLTDGFSLIKVSGTSETDRKYKYDKVEDAVNAVKSALQEGTVPGAGLALKQIADELPEGAILKRALCAPYEQIMSNAGEDFPVPAWVRNSVKVERVALEHACAIAADLATACGVVANERPKPRYIQEAEPSEE